MANVHGSDSCDLLIQPLITYLGQMNKIKLFALFIYLLFSQYQFCDALHHRHHRLLKELKPYQSLQLTHTKMDTLEGNFDHFQKQLDELDKDLEEIQKVLSIPKKIEEDLKEIDKLLRDIGKAARVVSIIPQIQSEAEELAKACDEMDKPVVDAKSVVHKVKVAVDPILKAVKKMRKKMEELQKKFHEAQSKIIPPVTDKILSGASCLDKVKKSSQRACVLEKADPEISAINLAYDEMNRVFAVYFGEVQKIQKLIQKLESTLVAMAEFSDALGDLKIALHKIDAPLHKLLKFLEKKFHFTLKVPKPTLKNPFHMKSVHIGISAKIIVQGIHKIEKEIKRILSKELYKIAKKLGLKKLAKKLMKAAKKEMNKLLKGLVLSIEAEFPSLDGLKKLAVELSDLFKALESLGSLPVPNFSRPDLGLPSFNLNLDLSLPSWGKLGLSIHESCCDLGARAVCK